MQASLWNLSIEEEGEHWTAKYAEYQYKEELQIAFKKILAQQLLR